MPKTKKAEKLIVSTIARPESLKNDVDLMLLEENKILRASNTSQLSMTALVCRLLGLWLKDTGVRETVRPVRKSSKK